MTEAEEAEQVCVLCGHLQSDHDEFGICRDDSGRDCTICCVPI